MPKKYKVTDKKTGRTYDFDWDGVGPPSKNDIRKIIDEKNKLPKLETQEEIEEKPSLWKKLNTPTLDVIQPGIRRAMESVRDEYPTTVGIGELAGDVASSLTSPLSAIGGITSGGASLAGKFGYGSRLLNKAIGGATAAHGGYKIATSETLPEKIAGGIEVGAGLLGARSPRVRPNILPAITDKIDDIIPEQPIKISAIQKLRDAVNIASPLNAKQKELFKQQLAEKAGKLDDVTSKGKEGFFQRASAMTGKLDTPTFEPPKLEPEDVNELFDAITNSPSMGGREIRIFRTQYALNKLLNGKVPQSAELNDLKSVFGDELIESVYQKAGKGELALNAINAPRALVSSLDMGAPFRQALPMIHKKEFWKAFKSSFDAAGSDEGFHAVMENIRANPNYDTAINSGLSLTDLGTIGNREEAFLSNIAEKIPLGVGKVVRASNRAHTAFLDKIRMDVYSDVLDKARKMGNDDPMLARELANFVNISTGRGGLGKLEQAAPILNGILFSPRLMSSRIQVLTYPARYMKASPEVRKESIKSLLAMGSIGSSLLGLSAAAGADVELNPTSTDFGKIKIGETRVDPWGGLQQYVRLGAVLTTGEKTSTSGRVTKLNTDKFGAPTYDEVIADFLRGKEAPIASAIHNLLAGQDIVGNDATVINESVKLMVPLILRDIKELAEEDPSLLGLTIPAFFGASVNTYKKKKSKGNSF